jgi:conjugative transfer signal peptidase TraF
MKHAPGGVLRGLGSVAAQVRCRRGCCRTCERALVGVLLAGALAAAVLGFGLHVNLSPSAARGLYRTIAGTPTRGAWVAACVSPEAAALGRARGYLGAGSCVGGVQPVIKPVVALAGDVVELGPEAVVVNGQRLPGSSSAKVDSLGLSLSHAVWGRHVVGADEFWLVSTHVPNSWDSRYLGPFSRSQVRAVAWPVWTWSRAGSEVSR